MRSLRLLLKLQKKRPRDSNDSGPASNTGSFSDFFGAKKKLILPRPNEGKALWSRVRNRRSSWLGEMLSEEKRQVHKTLLANEAERQQKYDRDHYDDLRLQGNEDLYNSEQLSKRKMLLNHPLIRQRIEHLWQEMSEPVPTTGGKSKATVKGNIASKKSFPGDKKKVTDIMSALGVGHSQKEVILRDDFDYEGCVTKQSYVQMSMKMQKVVSAVKLDEATMVATAEKDWEQDAGGAPYLDYTKFHLAVFEVADIWTDDVSTKKYVIFLKKLAELVTTPWNRIWCDLSYFDHLGTKKEEELVMRSMFDGSQWKVVSVVCNCNLVGKRGRWQNVKNVARRTRLYSDRNTKFRIAALGGTFTDIAKAAPLYMLRGPQSHDYTALDGHITVNVSHGPSTVYACFGREVPQWLNAPSRGGVRWTRRDDLAEHPPDIEVLISRTTWGAQMALKYIYSATITSLSNFTLFGSQPASKSSRDASPEKSKIKHNPILLLVSSIPGPPGMTIMFPKINSRGSDDGTPGMSSSKKTVKRAGDDWQDRLSKAETRSTRKGLSGPDASRFYVVTGEAPSPRTLVSRVSPTSKLTDIRSKDEAAKAAVRLQCHHENFRFRTRGFRGLQRTLEGGLTPVGPAYGQYQSPLMNTQSVAARAKRMLKKILSDDFDLDNI